MKRVIVFLCLALFAALVIQPNLAGSLIEKSDNIPVNTTSTALTNEDASLTQCESQATICIDADNGGNDYGYSEDGKLAQKDINLALALKLGDRLTKAGYHVIYTRQDDNVEDFYDDEESAEWRLDCAKEGKASYLISLTLFNDSDVFEKGYTIFTQQNDQMISLANAIANQFSLINYSEYKGIDSDHYENFPILENKDIPSILVEMGYITNESDYYYLTDEDYQTELADAILDAFLQTIN